MVKHCPFCGTEPKFKGVEGARDVTITMAFEGDVWHSGHIKETEVLNVIIVCPVCAKIETKVHYRLIDAVEDWNSRVNHELDLAMLVLKSARIRLSSLIPDKVDDYMLVQKVLEEIDMVLGIVKC